MTTYGEPLDAPLLLDDLLRIGVETKPDEPALVSVVLQRSWRDVHNESQRLATSYIGMGLKRGDRVASLMPNRAALLVHYIACLKAGLVAVPLNYRYTPPEIDHALQVTAPTLLLVHVERADDIAQSRRARDVPFGIVSFGDGESQRIGTGPTFDRLVDPSLPMRDLGDHPPETGSVIFFTSGSTGKPKGVTHTRETLGWILASFMAGYEIAASDILLPASSYSHIGGYVFCLGGLAAGARVDVPRTMVGSELLTLLRRTRPTALNTLPATLLGLVRDHDARAEDFSSLRFCAAAGDKASSELYEEFHALAGINLTEGYGMSETGFTTRSPFGAPVAPATVGTLNPGCAASVRDPDGKELPVGAEGRLWLKFPGIMVGYWDDPEKTAETIVDGWLDTGDVVRIDEHGNIWFRSRFKQIIVHDGSNISPLEVEEAVTAHPAVATAGVVGVHDPVHGENVRAYITIREGMDRPTDEAVIAAARERVGYKAPEEIVVLDDLPLNATGKIDRMRLKAMAEKDHAGEE